MCPVRKERRGSSNGMLLSRSLESEMAGVLAIAQFRNKGGYGKRYICQPLPKNRDWRYRDVVQLARTPALGAGGRTFESYHPDAVIPNGSRVPLGVFSNMQAAEFDSPTRWVPKRGVLTIEAYANIGIIIIK